MVYSKLPALNSSPSRTNSINRELIIPLPNKVNSPKTNLNSPMRPNLNMQIPSNIGIQNSPAQMTIPEMEPNIDSNLNKYSNSQMTMSPNLISPPINSSKVPSFSSLRNINLVNDRVHNDCIENGFDSTDADDASNNTKMLTDLLWSDPSNLTEFFMPSHRGSGWYFGLIATSTFLQKNDVKMIVRGHESIKKGVESIHENKIITVYSSSSKSNDGLAGCVVFDKNEQIKIYKLSPIDVIQRKDATFFTPKLKHYHRIGSLSVRKHKRKSA